MSGYDLFYAGAALFMSGLFPYYVWKIIMAIHNGDDMSVEEWWEQWDMMERELFIGHRSHADLSTVEPIGKVLARTPPRLVRKYQQLQRLGKKKGIEFDASGKPFSPGD